MIFVFIKNFSAVADTGELLEDTLLTVNSTGHVIWTTRININSWCSPNDLGRWPRDEHQCDVVLGFFNEFQNLQLVFNANESSFVRFAYEVSYRIYCRFVGHSLHIQMVYSGNRKLFK